MEKNSDNEKKHKWKVKLSKGRVHKQKRGKTTKKGVQQQPAASSKVAPATTTPPPPVPPPPPPNPRPIGPCVLERSRIIDFDVLIKHLKCCICSEKLYIQNTEKETRKGLSSLLYIRCTKCFVVTKVPTGKMIVEQGAEKKFRFDSNYKLAIGALDAGVSYQRLNKIFSPLNVPMPSGKTFQMHEKEAARAIEAVEKETEEMEQKYSIPNLNDLDIVLF